MKREHKRPGLYRAVLIALASALLFGCSQRGKNAAPPEQEEETVFAVNVTTAVEGQLFDYIEVNGDIVAQSSVDVYADTGGKLARLLISVGDYVRKDQVLAEIDPSRPGQTFALSPVNAPISGTITRIPVEIGAVVSAAVPVATVSKIESLEISTGVSERYIARVRRGERGVVELEAYPEAWFGAYVTELSPVVDPVSRMMSVTLAFRDPDRRIKAGMYAKVKIIVEEKQGIVKIPAECMITRGDTPQVFVVTGDSVAEAREIVPGISIDGKLEVVKGLSPGERVVIRGQTLLEDGAQVRIIDEVPPLESADSIL